MDNRKQQINKEINERLLLAEIDMILSGQNEMSVTEICEKTGLSRNAANRAIERGIGKFQKALVPILEEIRNNPV
jgi:predicted DNA-binding protein (UPF0251 family)